MSVVVCTTPRTGGTWLCRTLGMTLPMELLRLSARRRLRRLGYPVGNPAAIRAHASRHGIKVHWDHVGRFSWLPRLEDALPTDPEYVFLTRDDRDAQARSMLTAEQTGDWWTPLRPYLPDLNEREVAARIDLIAKHEAGWRGWFEERHITPRHITYEQLVGA